MNHEGLSHPWKTGSQEWFSKGLSILNSYDLCLRLESILRKAKKNLPDQKSEFSFLPLIRLITKWIKIIMVVLQISVHKEKNDNGRGVKLWIKMVE